MALFARPAAAGVDLPVAYLAQPDDQTCLPTCLAMALHYMGKAELTSETVFQLHKRTRYDRYNLPKIVADYNLYALPTWYELNWNAETLKKELDAGRPIITGCDLGRYGHFVLITGYTDNGRWIANDPSRKAPGYPLGGPHVVADFKAFNWRGGALIRPSPFAKPRVSARAVKVAAPKIMKPGEKGEVRITLKNNGEKPWPQPLFLEAIEPSFTRVAGRSSPFCASDSWTSPSRVMAVPPVPPDQTTTLSFAIQAPQPERPTSYKEYFGLRDAHGMPISTEEVSGPGIWDMGAKIQVRPRQESHALVLEEPAPGGKPSLSWNVKFGAFDAIPTGDLAAGRPGALRLLPPPERAYDIAWVGDSSWSDYAVEAFVYCEYRPDQGAEGFDRAGIFMRDNGDHAVSAQGGLGAETGEFYCMTYDSDDGRLRAGDMRNGGIGDFHPKPYVYLKQSGWHQFAIRCKGQTLSYELDGKPFHTEKQDDLRESGDCGVFCASTFPAAPKSPEARSHGVRFAGFIANP